MDATSLNPDAWTTDLRSWVDSFTHIGWLSTVVLFVILLILTAIAAHLVTLFLKRILRSENGPLPAVSIFINIGRVAVWTIGGSIILSSCFNVNVGAAITALGIGGIAISLGFQETLSNLIGGLQIIMSGLIEPGDHIKVTDYEGLVHDVTWRHTTLITNRGEKVVIPNSVINTEALVKLPPETDILIDVMITLDKGEALSDVIEKIEKNVAEAVDNVAIVEKKPRIRLVGKEALGYRGVLTFVVGDGANRLAVIDAAVKAMCPNAKKVSDRTELESTADEWKQQADRQDGILNSKLKLKKRKPRKFKGRKARGN